MGQLMIMLSWWTASSLSVKPLTQGRMGPTFYQVSYAFLESNILSIADYSYF
jgi:hypothetical protein